jgi:hypothetical protein
MILKAIEENGSITTMEAFEIGITRLASRVHDLRRMGINIISETVHGKNRYGEDARFARYKKAV